MMRGLCRQPTNTSITMNVIYSLFSEVRTNHSVRSQRSWDAILEPSRGSFGATPLPSVPATISPTRRRSARRSETAYPGAIAALKTRSSVVTWNTASEGAGRPSLSPEGLKSGIPITRPYLDKTKNLPDSRSIAVLIKQAKTKLL